MTTDNLPDDLMIRINTMILNIHINGVQDTEAIVNLLNECYMALGGQNLLITNKA